MTRILTIALLALLTAPGWAQTTKGTRVAPNPTNLTQFGFTDAEAKAAQADFGKFEQANRALDAQMNVFEAQLAQVMTADPLDRAAFEKLARQAADLNVTRQLAFFDQVVAWRTTYGKDKSRTLEEILRGGMQPGGGKAPPPPRKP